MPVNRWLSILYMKRIRVLDEFWAKFFVISIIPTNKFFYNKVIWLVLLKKDNIFVI